MSILLRAAKFSRPDALPNAGFSPSKYEALEGEKGGKVMIDVGTGKLSSATLVEPVIPGKGKGNRLLWSVGTSHDEGHVRLLPLTKRLVFQNVLLAHRVIH